MGLGKTRLQETVYDLLPHIVLVRREERRLEQLERAARDIVVGVQVLTYSLSSVPLCVISLGLSALGHTLIGGCKM